MSPLRKRDSAVNFFKRLFDDFYLVILLNLTFQFNQQKKKKKKTKELLIAWTQRKVFNTAVKQDCLLF